MATLLSFCQWLGETPLSIQIRESNWTYPIIESGVGIMGRGIGFY